MADQKNKPELSKLGDLTEFAKQVEKLFKDKFCPDGEDRPGIAISFVLPPKYDHAHYVTNLTRQDGINLFKSSAERMISETN